MKSNKTPGILQSLDWFTIIIYIALLAMGWMSICGASYDFDQAGNFLDFSTRSGMQIVWIASSLVLGAVILSTDDRWFESLSYIIYIGFLVLLFVTPLLARDIKGSMSWIKIGTFSIQPAEFAKFGTALCVAKLMGTYDFNMSKWKDFILCSLVILIPMALIIKQKETGSALVYLSFFLMMYRQGMPGCILFTGVAAVAYFVVGIRFADAPLWEIPVISMGKSVVLFLVQLFMCGMLYIYTPRTPSMYKLAGYSIAATAAALLLSKFVYPFDIAWVQLGICAYTVLYLLYVSLRDRLINYFYIALFAIRSVSFF